MKQIFSFITAMLAMITICHAQVNRQLSNLISPTAVNVNLLPGGTTGTKNLGSDTKRWKNGYFNSTVYCYGVGNAYGIYVTGTQYGLSGLAVRMAFMALAVHGQDISMERFIPAVAILLPIKG